MIERVGLSVAERRAWVFGGIVEATAGRDAYPDDGGDPPDRYEWRSLRSR